MKTMGSIKKVLAVLSLTCGLVAAHANSEGPAWDKAPDRQSDMAALQDGAKTFTNYCLNCHAAAFMRYTRLKDIGLTPEQIKSEILLTDGKVGDTMMVALDAKQAKAWFGATPPDLTVIARSRSGEKGSGADYLYTYLRDFYRDETPSGWNNLVFPNVGMPHVLWELQGQRKAIFEEESAHGQTTHVFKGWEQLTPGSLSAQDYDDKVANLVGYLQWMGEPAQATRKSLGIWVLLFLAGFTAIAWRLNQAYWKDIK
jgi:ubiquinol-cytochrome c reductase cytochrome c1 subunit